MTSREDLETAVLLLVGKACERALSKPKNRAKGIPDGTLRDCLCNVADETNEAWSAFTHDEGMDRIVDELGDIIASSGIALWRAHGGGE